MLSEIENPALLFSKLDPIEVIELLPDSISLESVFCILVVLSVDDR